MPCTSAGTWATRWMCSRGRLSPPNSARAELPAEKFGARGRWGEAKSSSRPPARPTVPEPGLDAIEKPGSRSAVLKHLRLLECNEPTLHHNVEHREECFDLFLAVDDLDDHGKILDEREDHAQSRRRRGTVMWRRWLRGSLAGAVSLLLASDGLAASRDTETPSHPPV
jgi:hypothetical protein